MLAHSGSTTRWVTASSSAWVTPRSDSPASSRLTTTSLRLAGPRYAQPGKYRVTVTLLDDDGGLTTDSFLVVVL